MAKRIGANGRKKMAERRGHGVKTTRRTIVILICCIALGGALFALRSVPTLAERAFSKIGSAIGGLKPSSVNRVEVLGATRIGPEELLKRAGITTPCTYDEIRNERLAAVYAACPWIGKVSTHRAWGGIVTLRITERQPVALVQAGKVCYVDHEGVYLPVTGRQLPDLPLLSGLRDSTGSDRIRRLTVSACERMNRFLTESKAFDSALAGRITQIGFGDRGIDRVMFEGSPTTVLVNEEEIAGGLERLAALRKVLKNDSLPPVRIDLACRGLAFVTPEKTPPAAASGVRKKGKA
jgi:hypothetical protein